MDLGVEVYPEMPRKKSKAVPDGSGPVPQDTSRLLGGITMNEISKVVSKVLNKSSDEWEKNLDRMSEITDKMLTAINQCSAGLEHDARQPRLATEAKVTADKKTRKCAEGGEDDQAKHGDSCSAKKLDAGPTKSTSFGMTAEQPTLPRRNDVWVDKGVAAPKPCLSPAEMHTLTVAGGLLPTGTASTAMRIILPPPLFSWSLGEETKKKRISRINNQLATPCWRRVIQTKSRQTPVFDLSGCTCHLRACPFWGSRRALLCGGVFVWTLR